MAGLGYKDFTNGTTADAAEADGYFMQQTIMRFESVDARNTALAAILADGLFAFTVDNGVLAFYYGGVWHPVFGPPAQSVVQNASGTTTSLTYVETLTGGTACAAVFDAPKSGRVKISYSAQILNSTTTASFMGVVVRTGGTIGSGTVVLNASDDDAAHVAGQASSRFGAFVYLAGLTPGATYNVRQAFKVAGASTGTYQRKNLLVEPLP